jgi:hypothetical protein
VSLLLRAISATAAISIVLTIWLVLRLVGPRGFAPLAGAGPLGILTLVGWAITLAAGPIAVVQLWRLKESGRIAGLIMFGFGLVYYAVGFVWLRAPEAQTSQIVTAVLAHAVLVVILALPAARRACN